MARDFPLGSHSLRFEEPDTMLLTWRGAMTADDVREISSVMARLRSEGLESCGILVDAREEGGISAAARKIIIEIVKQKFWHATCYFGAGFSVKVMIELVSNAARLIMKDAPPLAVVDTEQEARDWIRQHARA